ARSRPPERCRRALSSKPVYCRCYLGSPATTTHEEDSMTVKITIRPNGPYVVEGAEGEVELLDPAGNTVDLTGKARMALCRCGASVSKPFCDGTHSKIGFQAAEAAVAQEKK